MGIGATLINLAILTHIGRAAAYEIPMIMVAGTVSPLVKTVYTLILLAEVYTTAVGSLYGFVARLSKQDSPKYRYLTSGAGILALGLSSSVFQPGWNPLSRRWFRRLIDAGGSCSHLCREKIGKFRLRTVKPVQPSPSLFFHLAEEITEPGDDKDDDKDIRIDIPFSRPDCCRSCPSTPTPRRGVPGCQGARGARATVLVTPFLGVRNPTAVI